MTPIAIGFLVLAIVIVWGGFIASTFFLARHPDLTEFPAGGLDDDRDVEAPVERDT